MTEESGETKGELFYGRCKGLKGERVFEARYPRDRKRNGKVRKDQKAEELELLKRKQMRELHGILK